VISLHKNVLHGNGVQLIKISPIKIYLKINNISKQQYHVPGEQKIIATGCNHVIIRTAWLYSEFGKNFCKTMMNLTATKPELTVVFDQVGTPTYALDLAKAITVVLDDFSECHPERS
jgi:hypothetical protein